jgi:hypothetical protein
MRPSESAKQASCSFVDCCSKLVTLLCEMGHCLAYFLTFRFPFHVTSNFRTFGEIVTSSPVSV